MATQRPVSNTQAPKSADPAHELKEAANRAVMNKDFETDAPAPEGVDHRAGVQLHLSQRDQREHGVVGRVAFNVDGQLYIQDTVMQPNGDTKEVWRRGKRPLRS